MQWIVSSEIKLQAEVDPKIKQQVGSNYIQQVRTHVRRMVGNKSKSLFADMKNWKPKLFVDLVRVTFL